MDEPPPVTIFFLGATGYLGSQFLVLLAKELPHRFHVVALVRRSTLEKQTKLKALGVSLSIVEGTLDDEEIIQREVAKADVVINCASSDHPGSVASTLAGLEKSSASRPGNPPIYIHVSGLGIISDNSHDACLPTNTHLESDKLIVAASKRKENPIRTMIIFPGWIFGVGEGIQKITLPLRIFISMFRSAGYAGTWGKGHSRMGNIHVKDCANAILTVLKAALEGKADEGVEGFYFVTSSEAPVENRQIAAKMGDIMFAKGLLLRGGSQPLPPELLGPLGHYGWSLLGSNLIVSPERMKRFGWDSVESKKKPILDSLADETELALKFLGL